MSQTIISALKNLAQTSTMTSRHAAAVVHGKQILAMSTNHSVPAGELVDIATATKNNKNRVRHDGRVTCRRSEDSSKQTPFNRIYQRYQGFEERNMRAQEEQMRRMRLIQRVRCEKHPEIKEANPFDWVNPCQACRGECFGEVSF